MDKSPKRSPKAKKTKQLVPEIKKVGVFEKDLLSGKSEKNKFANNMEKTGKLKIL